MSTKKEIDIIADIAEIREIVEKIVEDMEYIGDTSWTWSELSYVVERLGETMGYIRESEGKPPPAKEDERDGLGYSWL